MCPVIIVSAAQEVPRTQGAHHVLLRRNIPISIDMERYRYSEIDRYR